MNNEPIRILHWGLLNGRGGVESYIMNLYRNIDRSKIQFDFLETHNMGELMYEKEIEQMGGRVFRILYSKRENYKKSKSCISDFLNEHPEIVGIHIHSVFLYGSLLKDAYRAGLPIRVIHSHASKELGKVNSIRQKLVIIVRSLYERRNINKYANIYLACSASAAKFMFPRKKYMWVKNGINVDKFDYNILIRNSIRNKLGISDKKVIGYVGHLIDIKNPFYLIDIFEEYYSINRDSVLLVVGNGGLKEKLEDYVEKKGLSGDVIFMGEKDNVAELYQAMDAFVLPSISEGLPIVLVEAQVSGLQCFVSKNISTQVKLTDNINFISIDESPRIWAEFIETKLTEYERTSKKEAVVDMGFDVSDMALKVQKCYLDMYNKFL